MGRSRSSASLGIACAGRFPTRILLLVVALAALPGISCQCTAACLGYLGVFFDPPITEEGRWTFQLTGAEADEDWAPCSVELPGGQTDCDLTVYSQALLVELHEGEIRAVRLLDAHPTLLRVSIDRDDQPVFGLMLEPAYSEGKTCGRICYSAGVTVSF